MSEINEIGRIEKIKPIEHVPEGDEIKEVDLAKDGSLWQDLNRDLQIALGRLKREEEEGHKNKKALFEEFSEGIKKYLDETKEEKK